MNDSPTLHIYLGAEHTAMLDAMCAEAGISRTAMARALLQALLEEDAAEHGACVNPDDNKVVVLRTWKRQ